jgi:hypothetical protein
MLLITGAWTHCIVFFGHSRKTKTKTQNVILLMRWEEEE